VLVYVRIGSVSFQPDADKGTGPIMTTSIRRLSESAPTLGVVIWLREDPRRGVQVLTESAGEVIERIRAIERVVIGRNASVASR
jgi:hypothetical protein